MVTKLFLKLANSLPRILSVKTLTPQIRILCHTCGSISEYDFRVRYRIAPHRRRKFGYASICLDCPTGVVQERYGNSYIKPA